MRTPAGSVILWVTPASTTLPRSMLGVSQSFFALLQNNVLDRRRWHMTALTELPHFRSSNLPTLGRSVA